MEYINQFTFNTGHNRVSYPTEVNKQFFFSFMPILNKVIRANEICEFVENTYINITVEDKDLYAATLYFKNNEEYIPFFSSMGTSNPNKRSGLIKASEVFRKVCRISETYMPPAAPLIIDVILPNAVYRTDVLSMTGDMSKCMGWLILDKEAIVETGL